MGTKEEPRLWAGVLCEEGARSGALGLRRDADGRFAHGAFASCPQGGYSAGVEFGGFQIFQDEACLGGVARRYPHRSGVVGVAQGEQHVVALGAFAPFPAQGQLAVLAGKLHHEALWRCQQAYRRVGFAGFEAAEVDDGDVTLGHVVHIIHLEPQQVAHHLGGLHFYAVQHAAPFGGVVDGGGKGRAGGAEVHNLWVRIYEYRHIRGEHCFHVEALGHQLLGVGFACSGYCFLKCVHD